jgi:hypothetical protein
MPTRYLKRSRHKACNSSPDGVWPSDFSAILFSENLFFPREIEQGVYAEQFNEPQAMPVIDAGLCKERKPRLRRTIN